MRRREGKKGYEMKQGSMTHVKQRKYVVVWPNLGPEASAELKKKKNKVSSEAVQQLPNAAEKAGAPPGWKETPSLFRLKIYNGAGHICMQRVNSTSHT